MKTVSEQGYHMEIVDTCRHVTPFGTSEDWIKKQEAGVGVVERYVIDNQPEV